MRDLSGLEVARFRATVRLMDPELGRVLDGEERDLVVTDGVRHLERVGILTRLLTYPDPSTDSPEEGQ